MSSVRDYICRQPHRHRDDFLIRAGLGERKEPWASLRPSREYHQSIVRQRFTKVEVGLGKLQACVDVDKEVRGGVPVIKDTRIPVSLVLAEVRDSDFLSRLARQFKLEPELLQDLFDQLASAFDSPAV